MTYNEHDVNKIISEMHGDTNNLSDGYHTFWELYDHRIALFIAMCSTVMQFTAMTAIDNWTDDIFNKIKSRLCNKSKVHNDWTSYEWWFLMSLDTPGGIISYHLPDKYWDQCTFATELEKANPWDGAEPNETITRLLSI